LEGARLEAELARSDLADANLDIGDLKQSLEEAAAEILTLREAGRRDEVAGEVRQANFYRPFTELPPIMTLDY